MTIKKLYILNFLFILSISYVSAQNCGFDQERARLLNNPAYQDIERVVEQKIANAMSSRSDFNRAGGVLTIPVVIHVLHKGEAVGSGSNISDAQIQSSIDNLNDFYRGQTSGSPLDFEIEFQLAVRDPNCNSTDGINRIDASGVPNYSADGISFNGGPGADQDTLKDLSRWPETDYFNIWIVSEIEGNNGGSGYQGYANFYYGNAYEGSVMMATVFGYDPTNSQPSWNLNFSRDNSTVVHEAGHYFHLYHTFQGDGSGGTCPTNANPLTDGDLCPDTVPHKRETSTCPSINSCTGSPWVDTNTINNIMSYYWCTDLMTNDQKTRVRAAMEDTAITNSNGATPFDPSYTAPATACITNTAANNTNAGILSVELNGTAYYSGRTGTDNGNLDYAGSCHLVFELDAAVSSTLNVGLSQNWQQLGVWIDWNNDGDFNDDSEQQYLQQDIPGNSTVPIILNFPTTIPYDSYVRIRLVEDLDNRYGPAVLNSPCTQSLQYGQSEDYAIYVLPGAVTPATYTYNGTWSPSNPQGTSTNIDTIVIQSGEVTINANTNCNTLTVNPGAAITVATGVTLNTTTTNLNSTSQAYASVLLNGTLTGAISYHRYVTILGTNDLISPPLSGQQFGSFATDNSNLAASGTIRAFAPYNTTTGAYENYDVVANASTEISSGIGFRAASTDGNALTFTGNVLKTDVLDIPISDATLGSAWNLIGNPYASYLDFDSFFNLNKTAFNSDSGYQAIYGYNGANGWVIWNQATIDAGVESGLIAPGQGFFVKAKTGGGLVDFTTTMRISGTSDDFMNGRQSNPNVAMSKITLSSAGKNAQTQIYFIEGTTRGLDAGYDAGTYLGNAGTHAIYSNLVEEHTGLNMAIQTLPYSDRNDVVVPLGVHAEIGVQFRIELDDTSILSSEMMVYLEDRTANTFTLLNDMDFVLTPSTDLNGTGRFFIHYSADTLTVADTSIEGISIFVRSSEKLVIVKGQLFNTTIARIYDLQGRLVVRNTLDASQTENSLDVSGVSTGVYIVQLSSADISMTQKVIIN